MSQQGVCIHCKKYLSNYFEVTRYNNLKENKGSVKVCSILCLINWSYSYGTQQTVKMAQGIKNLLAQLGQAIKG